MPDTHTSARITFAEAEPEDAADTARLVNAAFRGVGIAAGWTSEVGLLSGTRIESAPLADRIASQPGSILLMRDGDALVGCIAISPTADAATWHLAMLAIDPSRQTEGLGKQMLAGAEAHLHRKGIRRIDMTVIRQRTGLVDWYQRRGYQATGVIDPFPYGDDSVGTPLRADLDFVVLAKSLD